MNSGQAINSKNAHALPDWWLDWRGQYVAIVGAGPSAKTAGVEQLKDRLRIIAINESHKLCPWADIAYSCDPEWWAMRGSELKKFAGLKLGFKPTLQGTKSIDIPKMHNCWVNDFLFDVPGRVGSGGNSGFQMINLAAQFGVSGIALVGFDMRVNGALHWHGNHPSPLRNPDEARFADWRRHLDGNAHKLTARGIDVVNCSAASALTAFPKLTIEQTLERWRL